MRRTAPELLQARRPPRDYGTIPPPTLTEEAFCKSFRSCSSDSTRTRSSEKIGCGASGVPFPERNGALPAFVHGLLERLKHFGSVLRFVAFEGTFEIFKISGSVGNINGEVGGIGAVKWYRSEPDGPGGVESLGLGWGEASIVKLDVRMLRLNDLRHGVGHKAMIGVAVAAFGSPREDHIWVELVD